MPVPHLQLCKYIIFILLASLGARPCCVACKRAGDFTLGSGHRVPFVLTGCCSWLLAIALLLCHCCLIVVCLHWPGYNTAALNVAQCLWMWTCLALHTNELLRSAYQCPAGLR